MAVTLVAAKCFNDRRRRRACAVDGLAAGPARERELITLRFGLDDGVPRTLREVGDRLGIMREWRKIELRDRKA